MRQDVTLTPEQEEAFGRPGDIPIDLETEQALIGAVLREPDWMLKVMHVKAGHFGDQIHGRIWEEMYRCYRTHGTCSAVAVKGALEEDLKPLGGGKYLGNLMALSTMVLDVEHYARVVVDCAMRREVLAVLRQAEAEVLHPTDGRTAEEAITHLQGELVRIGDAGCMARYTTSKQVAQGICDTLKQDRACYSTGLDALNRSMAGGLYQGKSYGIAARKKVGKTVMASTISHNLNLAGVRHLFIAAEMSAAEIMQRNIARAIGRSSADFINENRSSPEFLDRVAQYAVKVDQGNAIYLDKPGIDFDGLRMAVARAKTKFGIAGFILDYWQLVGGKKPRESTAEHLDRVAQWIADYCRKEGLWSLVMAQINQEGNIRGSEGMRLAFDQVYHLQAIEGSVGNFWLEMMDTRYTPWLDVGAKDVAGLFMRVNGPHFTDV